MRINKFIANNSEYSRRKADELISAGKVKLNGKTIKLGTEINPDSDHVTVNNKPINTKTTKTYLILNKPTGYICSRKDEKGRKTIMELLPKDPTLKPVGRLDYDSEGLIFISNDGEFINQFTHPKFNCEKEYLVEISGSLSPEDQSKLEQGVKIDDKKTAPAKIKVTKRKKNSTVLKIVIQEGRNRQIRKMFACVNHHVKYLRRIRIGNVKLGHLKKGKFKKLSKTDFNANQLT